MCFRTGNGAFFRRAGSLQASRPHHLIEQGHNICIIGKKENIITAIVLLRCFEGNKVALPVKPYSQILINVIMSHSSFCSDSDSAPITILYMHFYWIFTNLIIWINFQITYQYWNTGVSIHYNAMSYNKQIPVHNNQSLCANSIKKSIN